MKKLMVAIALVSFTAFSFAAAPASNTKPAAKQETTMSAKCATPTSKTSKKDVKKVDKKATTPKKAAPVKK